jgi:hypothetical protein
MKLTPPQKELPEGVSLAPFAGIDAQLAPKWMKGNPQRVESIEDRRAALRDFQPEKLDLTKLRSLVMYSFNCKARGFDGPIGVVAVELRDLDAVSHWRAAVDGSMSQSQLMKVRFTSRGPVLMWFVYFEAVAPQCEALEKVISKKLDALSAEAVTPK